jgi:transcriptional regulator with XRE-family HTH domain
MATIPGWLVDVGPEAQDLVLGRFSALIEKLPFSQAELSKELEVSAASVSRWASRKQDPSLDHMIKTAELVRVRLAEVGELAEGLDDVLALVTGAVEAGTVDKQVPFVDQLRDLWAQERDA